MADSNSRILELSPAQRDLLLRRLAKVERESRDGAVELSPSDDGEAVPLSFAQERQWFLDRVSPGDPAFIIAAGVRLRGALSRPALQRAFDEVVRRHAALRTSIAAPAGKPAQTIAPPSPVPIETVDLTALPEGEREAACRARYSAETRRGFDLADDRLLRVTLVRLAADDHFLIFAIHHIVGDGWSIGILVEELAQLYAAFVEERAPNLPPLPIQYGDFARWQRERLQQGLLRRGLAYWRRQLADPPPVLELPADRPEAGQGPAAGRDYAGAALEGRIDPALRQRLEELSREEGGSLFATLLTAFMALLMRLTGQQDVLVGSPVSGRIRIETEALIGLFLNTLALRARLGPDIGFREAMTRVRTAVIEGLEHHEVPFEQVVQHLAPERSASAHPLFETFFNFTPTPRRTLDLPGLSGAFESPDANRCEFSTVLYVNEHDDALELRLVYQRARYGEARMAALLEQYVEMLRQAVDDPDRPLGAFDLVTPGARAVLCDPAAPLATPAQEPVTSAILRWAGRQPESPALSWPGGTLTYAAFAERMMEVAATLAAAGMAPGDVVAVHGRSCPDFIAAMAGALHAGGILLTVDADLPQERRALMLDRSGARFLLHAQPWLESDDWLRSKSGLRILDAAEATAAGEAAAAPPAGTADPAYIFFTSGSTGMPKPVLGTAGGLAHFLDWQRRTFAVGPGDRCAQITGRSFDVVLRDVFLPLTSGAELVLPSGDEAAGGARTLAWLESERITLIHCVPSLVEAWLIDGPGSARLASLRLAFFAGEPLTGALVRGWRRAFPAAGAIVNLYGPTETTLAKCAHRVGDAPYSGIQPLGRPLPQTQALVLTPSRRPCGIGEAGEIALRTPFRSLGYAGAPEETALKFIPNPYSGEAGDLLYLTGDRGLIGADGLLHFLGRVDDQVKIRGVRVEPSEVAATLRTSADVAACAIVVRDSAPGGPALVAYVVPAPEGERSARRLREYLRQRLPAPMVPSAFMFLDALPLTPNQKLDRSRLPAPDSLGLDPDRRHIAPRDPVELQIAQIWEDLLGVDRIGVSDSFFDLGGHSLLAMRLLVRIEQRLGRRVPLAALFEAPTIEHLAEVVRRQETTDAQLVKLWSGRGSEILFLVHTGGGTVLNYVPLVRHLAPHLPVHAVQAGGLSGEAEPHRDVAAMAADYIARLRGLQPSGPYRLGGHSFGGVIAYEMALQLAAEGEEVALLALFDSALARPGDSDEPSGTPTESAARDLARAVAIFRRFTGLAVDVSYESLRGLDTEAQIALVSEAFARDGSLPAADGAMLVRNLIAVARAHRQARRAYRPRPSPVPITLFRAIDGADDDRPADEEDLGWREVSGAPVRVLWVPGDHVTMMAERNASRLAEGLRPLLGEAEPESAARDSAPAA